MKTLRFCAISAPLRMRLFVLCARHEFLDCVLREHRVNELKKREGVVRELS